MNLTKLENDHIRVKAKIIWFPNRTVSEVVSTYVTAVKQ